MRSIVDDSFRTLYGHPCWGLHYDRTLNLSMNFGNPSLTIREPIRTTSASKTAARILGRRNVTIRGEWWLWIYCCHWRLSTGELTLATGASSLRKIERAISELEGQQLASVAIDNETGATRFAFDLGMVLHCRRFNRTTDSELWMLYTPSGYVLSVAGNGRIGHQRSRASEKRPGSILRPRNP